MVQTMTKMTINEMLQMAENAGDQLTAEEKLMIIAKLQQIITDKRKLDALARKKVDLALALSKEQEANDQHLKEITNMDLPLDWTNLFDSDERTKGVHADSISDGLILSLSNLGKVDIEYIASITGEDYKTVINALKGSIFQNPETWNECFYQGWETADEYLSGNLKAKWGKASQANEKYKGYFDNNVKAIEKILPSTVAAKDIYVTLGSPWVPADVIDDFIKHLFGEAPRPYWAPKDETFEKNNRTIHDEYSGSWEIPNKSRYCRSVAVNDTYGIPQLNALHILESTLNMKTAVVTKEQEGYAGSSNKRTIDKIETISALEKQQKLIRAFQDWIWEDNQRKERLVQLYEDKYGSVCRRIFDGSYLTFPTMSPDVQLYDFQKNAVARMLFSPNTLLAHDVGSGKTYSMIAAGQELRRMGLSKKNLYVVPNNIVGQWNRIFHEMYPQANVLVVEPKTFSPKERMNVLEKIRDDDFDGIIMAYSCFEMIPVSQKFCEIELQEQLDQISSILKQKNKATSHLRKKKKSLMNELEKLRVKALNASSSVFFDELGINRLFVDEAHNYKNVPIDSKANMILGVNNGGSKKCRDMMDKVHIVQKQNDGKGVVMATGTPITNSITEVYVMQQYLQSGELAILDLQSFDSWVGMFAEKSTEFEIDVDTSQYRLATRFSKFHNLPELTAILSSVADFHQMDSSAGIPGFDGYTDSLIKKTPELERFLSTISKRADEVRNGNVARKEDNMLKITTDGRKAALDLRLISSDFTVTDESKVAKCAENVADIYFKTENAKSTQLVFCDISTPKVGFNLYSDLKKRLVTLRVPEQQIAFIHDAQTEKQREELFEKVRKGQIRVLLGSTQKLGLGVNVQDKLIAVHHLDCPWRPADMVQREGRILRQKNTNKKVAIFRYITEGSFDAYSWQLLETKQRFISDLLSGTVVERSGSDVDDTVLDYAEVKALAIGNPLVKERVEVSNEIMRYLTLQRKALESKIRLEKELMELPSLIENQEKVIQHCENDLDYYQKWCAENLSQEEKQGKKEETALRRTLREELQKAIKNQVGSAKERVFVKNYHGFDVVLPANLLEDRPYVWLQRDGKYYVELGDTVMGYFIRIDNALEGLEKHSMKMKDNLLKLNQRMADIQDELTRFENYGEQIDGLKTRLENIDKELGVKKK